MLRTILTVFVAVVTLTGCRGPEGPAGPPGEDAVASLSDPAIMPKIIDTYPPANSVGPYSGFYGVIFVRFNKIMDTRSLRQSSILTSSTNDVVVDTNSISDWQRELVYILGKDTSVSVNYTHTWKIGEMGRLEIASTARDVNGNPLQPAFQMTFLPEPYFRLVSVFPDGTYLVNVASYPWCTVQFNAPIDTSVFPLVQIAPSLAGHWTYARSYLGGSGLDSTRIQFYPVIGFANNTTYTVTVPQTVHDKSGNHPPMTYTSSFKTAPFWVESTYPERNERYVSLTTGILIRFSGIVDSASARSAFHIDPPIPGNIQPYGQSGFVYDPSPPLSANTTYSVRIDTSMRSILGSHLAEPYQFSFSTGD